MNSPISPLDGRYYNQVSGIAEHLSETSLNAARVRVEIQWLQQLVNSGTFEVKALSASEASALKKIAATFTDEDAAELAEIEATTKHDVKAVEYLIRRRLDAAGLSRLDELVHFACTSEDINNLSYAITVKVAVEDIWLPALDRVIEIIDEYAVNYRDQAMLSRTHGQPATPTTLGKEFAVFAFRLRGIRNEIRSHKYLGKFSGATGTFSAHLAAAPNTDWPALSRALVESLGLQWNPLTTQIESHDWQVSLFYKIAHANGVLHNLATDIWTYISLGYFRQIPVPGATGSSTMPHKINPIKFENSEANLEISTGLLHTLATSLVTSRLQRDLTDSTTQRNIGVAIAHSLLALENLAGGLEQLDVAGEVMLQDLDENWEVLAEPIQTVIRAAVAEGKSSISDPYALLKDLTRGKRLTREDFARFIDTLDIPDDRKESLKALTPETYTGLASELIVYLRHFK
ncbi:MAG: adenylosuccinate lyase [Microbacteriaceae bacterium]|nr:adenylosuccinate lyase [Microbacteriaceae bacterium]